MLCRSLHALKMDFYRDDVLLGVKIKHFTEQQTQLPLVVRSLLTSKRLSEES